MILPQEGTLLAIAQIAVTLIGFASVAYVFRTGRQEWTKTDLIGQYIIFELSLASTFFAVLPIALFATNGHVETNLWRTCSGLSLLFGVPWVLRTLQRIRKAYIRGREFPISPLIAVLLLPFSLGMFLLMLANLLWLDTYFVHLWNILWMMMIAGAQLIIFVYRYAESSIAPSDWNPTDSA